jgi:outer membrane protein TolC
MKHRTNLARRLAALVLVLLSAAAAGAEDAPSAGGATVADAHSANVTVDAYVDGLVRALAAPRSEARALTLPEAIASAVRNNPRILAGARVTQQAGLDVLIAGGVYDPRIRIEGGANDTERLVTNAFESGVGGPRTITELHQDQATLDVALSKLLRYGTQLDLSWTNRRFTSDAAFQLLSPQYDPTLGLTVSQPLLKNFAGIRQRTTVLLARNQSRQSAAAFETTLANFVAEVVDAYWTYTQAEADLEVRRHALGLANELARDIDRRVKVGTVARVAASEARADAAAREEEVIRAENALDLAARTLQYRVMLGAENGGAPLPVRPAERHVVTDAALVRADVLRTAAERRPEVRNARLALAAAELQENVARNDLLPSLDVVGGYTLLGLGGDPLDSNEHDAYADALDRMTGGDFRYYSLGLRLEVPLSNVEARARHDREAIDVHRNEDELRRVVSDVALEVERTVGDVESARKRVEAARVSRELTEENLRDQLKRYEVGMVTTTDVLQFQDDVTSAMAAEVAAITDHARATAELRRTEGTLLERYEVRVGLEDEPAVPWWERF